MELVLGILSGDLPSIVDVRRAGVHHGPDPGLISAVLARQRPTCCREILLHADDDGIRLVPGSSTRRTGDVSADGALSRRPARLRDRTAMFVPSG
jgi:hypothetical protein